MAGTCLVTLLSLLTAGAPVVANPSLLTELNKDELVILTTQGFVGRITRYNSMLDIYEDAIRDGLPILVTTDPLFHTFHLLYDYTLQTAETAHFYPAVMTILRQALKQQTSLLGRTTQPNVRRALLANIAFLSVPLALLSDESSIPRLIKPRVEAELRLIRTHAGADTSHILELTEDFSRYRPSGRYTRNDTLQRYFLAVTYLSRMAFPLRVPDRPELSLRLTRQAILLSEAVEPAAPVAEQPLRLDRNVREPLAYLVPGEPSVLPSDYAALAREMRGRRDIITWLAEDSCILSFVARAESLWSDRDERPPTDTDTLDYDDGNPESATPPTVGVRLLNPRSLADPRRYHPFLAAISDPDQSGPPIPFALRAIAALGSARARQHLANLCRHKAPSERLDRLDSISDRLSITPPEQWNQDAVSAWLYALKLQLEPLTPHRRPNLLANFCLSPAYPDKTVLTACASYTEYQYIIGQGRMNEDPSANPVPAQIRLAIRTRRSGSIPVAYVEPRPYVFDQLAGIAEELKRRLNRAGFAHEELDSRLDHFSSACRTLAAIARQELLGIELSFAETTFCHGLGAILADLTALPDKRDGSPPLVLVTEPTAMPGLLLHQAVAGPCKLYALIPSYGEKHLAVGACHSWYEFTRPADRPVNIQEWQSSDHAPAMPPWTRSFTTR